MLQIFLWTVFWHYVTSLGVTVGYHRLLVHKSFQCSKPVEYFWTVLGTMALMGPPISWVAVHRFHHAHSDDPLDPHSPIQDGWWWSQVGWMLAKGPRKRDTSEMQPQEKYEWTARFEKDSPFLERWAPDFNSQPFYRWLTFRVGVGLWVLSVGIAYLIGGPAGLMGRMLATLSVMWCVWMINSVAHSHSNGYRNFETKDHSRNVWWLALISNGEGWHNNHHYKPQSARHGMRWYEFDLSWIVIQCMQRLGMAKKIHAYKLPAMQPQVAAVSAGDADVSVAESPHP